MKRLGLWRMVAIVGLLGALMFSVLPPRAIVEAQSGRQPAKKNVEKKTDEQKGDNKTKSKDDNQEPIPPLTKEQKDEPPIKIATQVVGVEISVIDKKTGRLIPGLTKKNFKVYEDNIQQEITNFSSGEGPATVVLLIDNGFQNRYFKGYFNPTFAQEIFQSAAGFIQNFVKPKDYVSLITFSMRPKVIQDFTNNGAQLYSALNAASRDTLNFSESNIYDGLSFALLGGKAYQLYNEQAGESEYVGLQEVEGRTAIILITTGIDTFSRITFDKALRITSNAGVPIFTIGVGNLFYKKYEQNFPPELRLTYLQAFNQLGAFAERTGGSYFPMTFESEIPQIMRSIEVLLRNQYDLGYVPTNTRREGKERKIKLEVDLDGDGQPDNKHLELRYRNRYFEPGEKPKK
ncbi:MAG: VWA domain-containing protein [Acidobacteria bacterium]|nr:VWA domain-containing protein [Acidobacteriota bacterium]